MPQQTNFIADLPPPFVPPCATPCVRKHSQWAMGRQVLAATLISHNIEALPNPYHSGASFPAVAQHADILLCYHGSACRPEHLPWEACTRNITLGPQCCIMQVPNTLQVPNALQRTPVHGPGPPHKFSAICMCPMVFPAYSCLQRSLLILILLLSPRILTSPFVHPHTPCILISALILQAWLSLRHFQ